MTPSTFLSHLSSPTSDWPHYVTTPASTASPPSSVYHPTASYREDGTAGSGSDDYHFFTSHAGLDLASSFISGHPQQSKDSPSLRLQSQQAEPTDEDADIGDEIHLANMAFINASSNNKAGHRQHHHQEQRTKTAEGYPPPNDYNDDATDALANINDP